MTSYLFLQRYKTHAHKHCQCKRGMVSMKCGHDLNMVMWGGDMGCFYMYTPHLGGFSYLAMGKPPWIWICTPPPPPPQVKNCDTMYRLSPLLNIHYIFSRQILHEINHNLPAVKEGKQQCLHDHSVRQRRVESCEFYSLSLLDLDNASKFPQHP